MDKYPILVAELTADPLKLGYAAMTDAERLASLIAPTRARPVTVVSRGTFLAMVAPLVLRLANKEPAIQQRWTLLMTMLTGGDDTIDVARPQIRGLVQQAVADKVMTVEEAAGLASPASVPISRAEELGIAPLGLGHLKSARDMEAR